MKWLTQKQSTGDNGTNINVGRDANFGLNYRDVKEVARDTAMEVFRENFTTLSRDALLVAVARAEELTENFLKELRDNQPEGFKNLEDPGVQSAIFDAQAAYAKTGDAKLGDILVGILVDRSTAAVRDVTQLSLESALRTVQSLSGAQISLLTCNFIVKHVAFPGLKDVADVANQFARAIEPFEEGIKQLISLEPDYLVGVGCLIAAAGSITPQHYLGMNYPGLFSEGFTLDRHPEARSLIGTPLAKQRAEMPDRYFVQAASIKDLNDLAAREGLEGLLTNARSTLTKTVQPDSEILRQVLIARPKLAPFFERWRKLGMSSYLNTPVALVIAHANARRIIGEEFNAPVKQWFG
ncbi:LPO_1073/Vpar_1526 family protein [Streptomyces sp. NPDC005784]|uniref:LPO_1073/Vpar_1526 family protein n=1 Tax=Streptomyces sp. NPDC005784 TaxID=3364731 RepID=UPI0036A3B6D4